MLILLFSLAFGMGSIYQQGSQVLEEIKGMRSDSIEFKVFMKDHERRITKLETK